MLRDYDIDERIQHLKNLVVLAHHDGELHADEKTTLELLGEKWGLPEDVTAGLFSSPETIEVILPSDADIKLNQFFDAVDLALGDGVLKHNERILLETAAKNIGYHASDVRTIIDAINQGNKEGFSRPQIVEGLKERLS